MASDLNSVCNCKNQDWEKLRNFLGNPSCQKLGTSPRSPFPKSEGGVQNLDQWSTTASRSQEQRKHTIGAVLTVPAQKTADFFGMNASATPREKVEGFFFSPFSLAINQPLPPSKIQPILKATKEILKPHQNLFST